MFLRIGLCLILSAIMMVSPVSAAEQAIDSKWRIPFLGEMSGNDKFQAIDMVDWLKTVEDMIKKDEGQGKDKTALPIKEFEIPKGVKFYQLQADDGKAYHIAAAVAVKDEKGEFPGFSDFFAEALAPENAVKLAEWNEKVKTGIALAQDQLATTQFAGLKVMDFKPLERMRGTNEVIYSVGGRILFNMNGAMFPLYAKMYVAEREGKAAILVIVTSDADGRFWEKTCDRLVQSLRK